VTTPVGSALAWGGLSLLGIGGVAGGTSPAPADHTVAVALIAFAGSVATGLITLVVALIRRPPPLTADDLRQLLEDTQHGGHEVRDEE